MRIAIFDHPEADGIIFLGDGERDFDAVADAIGDKRIIAVRGNCDFGSTLPPFEVPEFAGVKIYCTHGYVENVKYGTEMLLERARDAKARIALYGHTHKAVTEYEDGIYIMNPGTASCGDYGIIDITPGGIMCINASI